MGSGASDASGRSKQFGAPVQRSHRVTSLEMDEVIRVKAKVVTSENGEGAQRSTRVTSLDVELDHLQGLESPVSQADSDCQSPFSRLS
eukprot:s1255_g4.t1